MTVEKPKPKANTPTNHNRSRQRDEPITIPSNYLKAESAKTIVNANASKRKLFYAFRPSVHTKTMKTLTVNA